MSVKGFSVNGQTEKYDYNELDNKPTIPSKTSDLTNDSGFITSAPVTSVNGQTGAVVVSVPTKTSDLTNDSGFITNAGVTSFNGSTGAVTYTAPVTSVNGSTGAVTISVPTTAADVGAIAAPANPSSGQFLVYDGSAWSAMTLATWSAGSY